MQKTLLTAILTVLTMFTFVPQSYAVEEISLVIKDHKFIPDTVEIPAGQKVKLIIDNQDPTPEEFESHELNREKIIKGGKQGIVFIGPLEPGTYPFFGEFNEDTAQGKVVVK